MATLQVRKRAASVNRVCAKQFSLILERVLEEWLQVDQNSKWGDWNSGYAAQVERVCLCGPGLVSSAGDAGCSESEFPDPECWLIPRSHKGCCWLVIAGRWP